MSNKRPFDSIKNSFPIYVQSYSNLTIFDQNIVLVPQFALIETFPGVSRACFVNLYLFTPLPLLWIISNPPISSSTLQTYKED